MRMRELLAEEEYAAFLKSYGEEIHRGLRVNMVKIPVEDFLKITPFSLRPVPWAGEGFFYEEAQRPGIHPYHEAGLYYIQEPSAMAPAEYLGALPGERVLDLCASPGGKSTQIAADMQGQGILIKRIKKGRELYGIQIH